VRAYPQGEAAADEALLVNLELRWDLPLDTKYGIPQLVFFYDFGRVLKLHDEPWFGWQGGNTALLNSYSIDGAGIGFNLTKSEDYVLRAVYARKIRDNAGADSRGNDSDNRDNDNRFWLQMMKQF
jgi:hemolysin activation/secretion protein